MKKKAYYYNRTRLGDYNIYYDEGCLETMNRKPIATAYSEAHAALIVKALNKLSVEDTTAALFGE